MSTATCSTSSAAITVTATSSHSAATKDGVYAIPYAGEEVKLHWANSDQYYVKSSEQFRDYRFRVTTAESDQRRVHFNLVEADTPTDSNLPQAERRFFLAAAAPVSVHGDELTIRFEFRVDGERRKQRALNNAAVQLILDDPAARAWRLDLLRATSSAADAPSLLTKHLDTYTSKNTTDYFIHKDLGGFLRRELDFYLKNEVMHLDDIDTDSSTAHGVLRHMAKLKALRRVGGKLIDFLAQIEDFQKRLWLKKKFVVDTHWCVTLDRVPKELYPEIAANEAQRLEWVSLFAIDDVNSKPLDPPYSEPLTDDFLRSNPYLPVDTSLFNRSFSDQLLASIDNIDDSTDGILIRSDNFHALNLLQERLHTSVSVVYIDPPYNTDSSAILYKNSFRHSSWLSLMASRIQLSRSLLSPGGIYVIAIDDTEFAALRLLIEAEFTKYDQNTVVVNHHPGWRWLGACKHFCNS